MLTNIWSAKLAVDTKATSFRLAPGRAGTFDQTGFNNDTCLEHAPSDPTNTNTFDNTSHRSLSIQLKRFLTETRKALIKSELPRGTRMCRRIR